MTLNLLGKILDPKIELLKAMLFEIAPYERQSFGEIEVKTLTLYEVWPGGAFPFYRRLQSFALGERC